MIAQTVKQRNDVSIVKGPFIVFSILPDMDIEKEITAVKIKNKLSYPEARRVVSSRTPVSGKSYASATSKTYVSTAIQVDASTAPKSAQSDSVKLKPNAWIHVRLYPLHLLLKRQEKHASRNRGGAIPQKKKRSNLSKNSMTWETMSWTFMPPPTKRRESDGRSVAQTFVFWLLARSKCEAFMTSLYLPWNCRGLRTRLADLKSIISTYQPHALLFRRHF
ncbi:hypothetical protein TNCV_3882211 [Trichonephila clavipes]|nr:hypothetical protein TNCV_3882211 [Trichonephila clavipes]